MVLVEKNGYLEKAYEKKTQEMKEKLGEATEKIRVLELSSYKTQLENKQSI